MHALLFSDQMKSHLDHVVIADAYQRNVHLWSLVANTSHWLQPLDDFPFGLFKKFTTKRHTDAVFNASITGRSYATSLMTAAYEAESQAFTGNIIRAAFKNCGLYPFDEKQIFTRLAENTGVLQGDEVVSQCMAAATAVIVAAKAEGSTPKKRIQVGSAVVRRNVVYSPQAILAERARKEAEEAAQAKTKADERVQRTCRFPDCPKVHRNSAKWSVCSCGAVRFCPAHLGLEEAGLCSCDVRPTKRQPRRSPSHPSPPAPAPPIPAIPEPSKPRATRKIVPNISKQPSLSRQLQSITAGNNNLPKIRVK